MVLLGAEGCSELKDAPYVRDATSDEYAAWKARFPKVDMVVANRPYFLMVVDVDHPECSKVVADRARSVVRTIRLTD
jgi:hypothetical protein